MKYYKIIDGSTIIKDDKNIIIYKNGKQIINPSEDFIISDGWLEYSPEPVLPSPDEIFQQEKEILIDSLMEYDSSESVNIFYVGEFSMWLDKATRVGLKLRFDAEIAKGKDETILWYNGQQFTLPLESALFILNEIELYASACYDNTQHHLSAIQKISTVEELRNYDFKTGYPEKLTF